MIVDGSGPGGEEAALKAVGRKACGLESCRFRHFYSGLKRVHFLLSHRGVSPRLNLASLTHVGNRLLRNVDVINKTGEK